MKTVEQNHLAAARFAENSSLAGETLARDHAARQRAEPAKHFRVFMSLANRAVQVDVPFAPPGERRCQAELAVAESTWTPNLDFSTFPPLSRYGSPAGK